MSQLHGRIALVTGANRGLGREIARQLARLGARVVLTARNGDKARRESELLAAEGLLIDWTSIDVDDPASVSGAIDSVERGQGRIDILVNNAGVLLDGDNAAQASLLGTTREQMLASLSTNVLGPLHMMQAVLPGMKARGYGRIVNISSRAGQLDELRAGWPTYRVSKTALNSLTRVTAAEFQSENIKINAMCPGWVKTAMGGANAPLTPEEGTRTVIWLATLPDDGPTGGFFRDLKPLPW